MRKRNKVLGRFGRDGERVGRARNRRRYSWDRLLRRLRLFRRMAFTLS